MALRVNNVMHSVNRHGLVNLLNPTILRMSVHQAYGSDPDNWRWGVLGTRVPPALKILQSLDLGSSNGLLVVHGFWTPRIRLYENRVASTETIVAVSPGVYAA
jgi:hypothetical protein